MAGHDGTIHRNNVLCQHRSALPCPPGCLQQLACCDNELVHSLRSKRRFATDRTDPGVDIRNANGDASVGVFESGSTPLFGNVVLTTDWHWSCHHRSPLFASAPPDRGALPHKLIWNVRGHEFYVHRVCVFTNNVHVCRYVFRQSCSTADQDSFVIWVFLNDCTVENRFKNMLALKSFFQGVLDDMAFYKVIPRLHSRSNCINVHVADPHVVCRDLPPEALNATIEPVNMNIHRVVCIVKRMMYSNAPRMSNGC